MRPRVWTAAALAATVLLAAGCGDDEETASGPARSEPGAARTATTEAGRDGTTATTGRDKGRNLRSPEDVPGGPGDEIPIRVPATFTVRAGRLTPSRKAVPAFLALRLSVASRDGRAHTAVLRGDGRRYVLRVPAGGRASRVVEGMRPGRYPLVLDGGRSRAILESSGEAG